MHLIDVAVVGTNSAVDQPTRLRRRGIRVADEVRVEDRGEQLDAVDQARSGPHDDGIGVDGPHLGARREDRIGGRLRRPVGRRHRAGSRTERRARSRRPTTRSSTTRPLRSVAHAGRARLAPPAAVTRSGTQCPAVNAGSVHSSTSVAGRRAGGDACSRRVESSTTPLDESGGDDVGPCARADGEDRVEHLVERHRIERQHFGVAPQVGQRVVDLRHVDRAHRAQILRDDELGVEVGEGAAVEAVQVLAGCHPLLDGGVDAGRVETLRAAPTSTRSASCEPPAGSCTRTSRRRRRRPSPSSNRISVADGSSDTIRTTARLGRVPAARRITV